MKKPSFETMSAISILEAELSHSPVHTGGILMKCAVHGGKEAEKAIQLIANLSQI